MDFAAFARDYGAATAALVVGLIGFGGVIAAQFINAYLARAQQDRAVAHERRTVRTALLEELKFLKLSFEDRQRVMSEAETHGAAHFVVPTDTMTDAYHRMLDRIGLLSPDEVSKAMQAYLAARQIPAKLRLIGEGTVDWIRIDQPHFANVRTLHRNHAKLVDDAIKAIETRINNPSKL